MDVMDEDFFFKIHAVVLDSLRRKGLVLVPPSILSVVGSYYCQFVHSNGRDLTLKLPFYDKEYLHSVVEYILYLDLILKMLQAQRPIDYQNLGIFDIISYENSSKYAKQTNSYALSYVKSKGNSLFFGDDVVVSQQRFIPLFDVELIDRSKEAICDAFFLFKCIAKTDLISYPVYIPLEKGYTLLITDSFDIQQSKLSLKTLITGTIKNDNERDHLLDSLEEFDVRNTIILKYPYYNNIGSVYELEFGNNPKLFTLNICQRLCYDQIGANEVVLLPSELDSQQDSETVQLADKYSTINTDHPKELYDRLKVFKACWKAEELNVFRYSFPAKWFMCINQGEAISFWKKRFDLDFPLIVGSLLNEAFTLIELIYQINWLARIPYEKGTLLIPRSSLFPEVIKSLKDYLSDRFGTIKYSDEYQKSALADSKIIVLDAFNCVQLSNILSRLGSPAVQVLVPDFLYFGHKPYIKYYVAKYQADALLEGSRKEFDKLYPSNLIKWTEQKGILLKKILLEVKAYTAKYGSVDINPDFETENNDVLDMEYDESEVIDHLHHTEVLLKKKENFEIKIQTIDGDIISLMHNSQILIKHNGVVLRTIAAMLKKDSWFIPLKDVETTIDISFFVDRLSDISEKARRWRYYLGMSSIKGQALFRLLKDRGLSIKESTFNNDYIDTSVDGIEFRLPRSRKDWEIVCDYLAIPDMRSTWIAHKCREDINRLKEAYSNILSYLISTSSFGINVPEHAIIYVKKILSEMPHAEDEHDELETDARSVITNINNRIKLIQVDDILL